MHTLIVVPHPDVNSLTHAVAKRIASRLAADGAADTVELADLAGEGFSPVYTEADAAFFQNRGPLPADVATEQARIDRADTLVLVYPIYWWSFPALLKGWIDRVFTNGWAYQDDGSGRVGKCLQRLHVHLVALGGADQRTIARHGYFGAMRTQIDHGIFDYCGATVVRSELLLASDAGYPDAHLAAADAIGGRIANALP